MLRIVNRLIGPAVLATSRETASEEAESARCFKHTPAISSELTKLCDR
jgi:hypothetical protein